MEVGDRNGWILKNGFIIEIAIFVDLTHNWIGDPYMTDSGATPLSVKGKLDANGRLVIPAAIREQIGATPGETLFLDVEDEVLRVETFLTRIRRIQAEVAKYVPAGVMLSEELIAERREEFRREEEKYQREMAELQLRKAG